MQGDQQGNGGVNWDNGSGHHGKSGINQSPTLDGLQVESSMVKYGAVISNSRYA